MRLVGREEGGKVKFSGGTYCAHPASMLAAKIYMSYLIEHEEAVYSRLAELGEKIRHTVETAFAHEGIHARCTGYGNDALPSSSLNMLLFPYEEDCELVGPEDTRNPSVCDIALGEYVLQLALLLENVHVVHGLGSATYAHTDEDLEFLGEACHRAARRIKPYL